MFCYSLGDVFEAPRKLANWDVCNKGRDLLFAAIGRLTPRYLYDGAWLPLTAFGSMRSESIKKNCRGAGLIFLLLTKRPENVRRMVPATWLRAWPQHVWLGTSVENQQAADERIPHLLDVPGVPVRFLSLEPLLERVDLREDSHGWLRGGIDWLIPGGEGNGRRPCELAWIRDIRDQGKAAGVPVFIKQLGSNPVDRASPRGREWGLHLRHPKGEDPSEWPEDLRIREVPSV